MLRPLTLKLLALFIVGYGLLMLPGMFWPQYFDSPAGLLLLVPYLSVLLFHQLGISGLLEQRFVRLGVVFTDCVRCHFHGDVLGDSCVDACLGFGSIVIAIFRCKEIVNDFDPISGLNQPGAILPG